MIRIRRGPGGDRAGGELGLLVPALAVLFLGLCAGCTVQGPSPEGQVAKEKKEIHPRATSRLKKTTSARFGDLKPIRIDYLRPVRDIEAPELYVYKDKRRLYVLDRGVLVRNYPIGLGKNPKGDKREKGDGRTPEGTFYVCLKNPRSKFYKSVAISYPSRKHAESAFMAGLISSTQYRDIILALERKVLPPWNTPLGGNIFIHGGGAQGDWTDGCIALYNSDMKELYQFTRIGTPVVIRP